jgi:DNA mismatch repair protein MSH4
MNLEGTATKHTSCFPSASLQSLTMICMNFLRATSNEDGVAIAWSVAECLIASGAMTFFATHYPQICDMGRVYNAVQNQHLQATLSSNGNNDILYSHKIQKGPCLVTSRYGVDIAAKCGWPEELTKEVSASPSVCC